ncbi:MAG: SsrA-binding protein SmpB [Rhizobiales bacterium]|nr:SsrA-binding protein SmpB [Hyphomicrobiales bacterium]
MTRKPAKKPSNRVAADNRRARFSYEIVETFEAGIILTGTEVKSLRQGKSTIAESYASEEGGEIWLINAYIPEYLEANRFNHQPRRKRKLLLHRRQVEKLSAAIQREGMTLVPLKMYFNDRGRAKVEVGLGRGKKLHDKRETEKQRDWGREKARLLRDRG